MVSIIIPIYNTEPYLQKCLESIRRQTYSDLEVIMVDDGSTDHSIDTAQSFADSDSRFHLIRQPHQGQSEARNLGLEQATGQWLMFVDSDDWLDIECVACLVLHMGTNDVLNYGYRRVNHEGIDQKTTYPHHPYQLVSSCMRLYRTAWLKEHQILFPTAVVYDDVFYSIAVWSHRPRQAVLPYAGYNYRATPHSVTSSPNYKARRQIYDFLAAQSGIRMRCIALYVRLKLNLHFLKTDFHNKHIKQQEYV